MTIKGHTIWAVIVAAVVLVGLREAQRAWQFEKAKQAAEQFVKQDSLVADSLKTVAEAAHTRAIASDTARAKALNDRDAAIAALAKLPAPTKTDTACTRNIAERDDIIRHDGVTIADDTKKLGDWQTAWTNLLGAYAHAIAERDTLSKTLKNRPAFTLDILSPRIQISAVYMVIPEQRIGIAVSIPLVSFKLKL